MQQTLWSWKYSKLRYVWLYHFCFDTRFLPCTLINIYHKRYGHYKTVSLGMYNCPKNSFCMIIQFLFWFRGGGCVVGRVDRKGQLTGYRIGNIIIIRFHNECPIWSSYQITFIILPSILGRIRLYELFFTTGTFALWVRYQILP